ncbi:MAG: HAD-IA family hydrolase [Gammaproteobacteria bacterium]|nr:HAD-IA family hydrolase [Gammaproteobacteria bacterium]MYF31345.1 HAD-IA family hydrolase [Gammaproteobacteria bacterium]MYK46137.1 HAD-IA family hydrolase [Gammaproteobacteria bacterium]
MIEAVLWDFGGVFTTSPFEAFNRFELARGLPENFIRTVNSTNLHDNAWAKFESSEIDVEEFDEAFRREAEAHGHSVRGKDVLALLPGEFRPRMARVLTVCKAHYKVGCITNNMKNTPTQATPTTPVPNPERAARTAAILEQFDVVVESSVEGIRKPDPRIYRLTCDRLGVAPGNAVFLDDLGINLKPARAMGMITIKVVTEDQAIADLERATGLKFP